MRFFRVLYQIAWGDNCAERLVCGCRVRDRHVDRWCDRQLELELEKKSCCVLEQKHGTYVAR